MSDRQVDIRKMVEQAAAEFEEKPRNRHWPSLLCRLGLHRWGGSWPLIWVCERDDCFAERRRRP